MAGLASWLGVCNLITVEQTLSAKALDAVLAEDGAAAKALRLELERTSLWRYRHGHTIPTASTAAAIEKLSGGAVPANGWIGSPKGARKDK